MSDSPNVYRILYREGVGVGADVTVDDCKVMSIEVVQSGSRICLDLPSSRKLRKALKRAEQFEKARHDVG